MRKWQLHNTTEEFSPFSLPLQTGSQLQSVKLYNVIYTVCEQDLCHFETSGMTDQSSSLRINNSENLTKKTENVLFIAPCEGQEMKIRSTVINKHKLVTHRLLQL